MYLPPYAFMQWSESSKRSATIINALRTLAADIRDIPILKKGHLVIVRGAEKEKKKGSIVSMNFHQQQQQQQQQPCNDDDNSTSREAADTAKRLIPVSSKEGVFARVLYAKGSRVEVIRTWEICTYYTN